MSNGCAEASEGVIDEVHLENTFGNRPGRLARRDLRVASRRVEDRESPNPDRRGNHRGVSRCTGEARTLSGNRRGPRVVGAKRLGERADRKARRAGLCGTGRGPLSRQGHDRYERSARANARGAGGSCDPRHDGRLRLSDRWAAAIRCNSRFISNASRLAW
jgi:hypothetical protein